MSFTKSDLAISTMWNFRKAHSGEELIDQLTALGFSRVELNYQVRTEWLSGIRRRIREGAISVSSVHNVFPKTLDKRFDTDSVMLGYEDEGLRQQAVELAKGSIEWACVLGAGAVVFHPTEVPLDPQAYDVPLKQLIAAHRQDTEEYRTLHAQMLAARRAQPYLDRMMKSIDELANYVAKYDLPVRLGMENRAMCHQAPIFAEFDLIADRFAGGPVGIWLDTGHAIMMEEMGLQQLPLSDKAADMIVGMHIHDAVDALDHYAPCTLSGPEPGTYPVLAPYRDYILRSPIKVLELSGRLSAEEIVTGTDRFVAQFGG
ncbi:MAG: TIM barrel protein [Clostridia bacterium]|nr:TIM barrel protein [Clostridia bacterium]